jgi:hypothetical protein
MTPIISAILRELSLMSCIVLTLAARHHAPIGVIDRLLLRQPRSELLIDRLAANDPHLADLVRQTRLSDEQRARLAIPDDDAVANASNHQRVQSVDGAVRHRPCPGFGGLQDLLLEAVRDPDLCGTEQEDEEALDQDLQLLPQPESGPPSGNPIHVSCSQEGGYTMDGVDYGWPVPSCRQRDPWKARALRHRGHSCRSIRARFADKTVSHNHYPYMEWLKRERLITANQKSTGLNSTETSKLNGLPCNAAGSSTAAIARLAMTSAASLSSG